MIKRPYIEKIKKWLWKEKIIILKWARQVGKTTILLELQKQLIAKWSNTVFLEADNISNKDYFASPDDFIYFLELEHNINNYDYTYIFIDEFQYIVNAWLFLKNIFDKYKKKIQIIVSGSSSLEISKNKEFLTGRNIEYYIDRVSFQEFFYYKTAIDKKINIKNYNDTKKFYKIYKTKLERYFMEYLSWGGYPEVVTSSDVKTKLDILSSIYDTYIQKDIIDFLNIENIGAFNKLIKILASQVGNLLNQSELTNTLGISRNTVIKYLEILKWTYIFSYTSPYYTNIRKELTKMPKVFWEDLGIINYILWKNFILKNEVNIWSIVENFVYKVLQNSWKYSTLYFYQTISKSEIDFVLECFSKNLSIYEVKYRSKLNIPMNFSRFENSYKEILKYKILVSKDILYYKEGVYIIPACLLWLLTFNSDEELAC